MAPPDPPSDKNNLRLIPYVSHTPTFNLDGAGENEEGQKINRNRGFDDIDGTESEAWIPDAIGLRAELNLPVGKPEDQTSFTVVTDLMLGDMARRMQPLGLQENAFTTLGNEKFRLHFPELSLGFKSGGLHGKAGYMGSPYTKEIPCLNSDLAILTHSFGWNRVPYGWLNVELGGGEGHFDLTAHLAGGGDRFFNKLSSNNFLAGLWVTLTPSDRVKIIGRIDFGQKEGEQTGIMEFLMSLSLPSNWSVDVNVLSAWDAVPQGDGTKEIQQWWSFMTPVTWASGDWKLTLRPEGVVEVDGTGHFAATLGAAWKVWAPKNTDNKDLGGVTLAVELRHDQLGLGSEDRQGQTTLSLRADLSYLWDWVF